MDHDPGPDAGLGRVLAPQARRNRALVELGRTLVALEALRELQSIAAHAGQLRADHRVAAGPCLRPRPQKERRIVSNVLAVAAVELGDPVARGVEMVSRDRPVHGGRLCLAPRSAATDHRTTPRFYKGR